MSGFASLNKRAATAAASVTILTVKEIVEESGVFKMIATDEAGTEYKILPKGIPNKTTGTDIQVFDEATRPGSILSVSAMTKKGDEWELGYSDWVNRYPSIMQTLKLPAIGIRLLSSPETGKTNAVATILDLDNKVAIHSPEDVAKGVDAALASTIVPAAISERGLLIAYKNAEGHPLSTILSVGSQKSLDGDKEVYVPNDVDVFRAETIEGVSAALADEIKAGSTDIVIVPVTRMFGSQNMITPPKNPDSKSRFPMVVDKFATSVWRGRRDPTRVGKNYGVLEALTTIQPLFDIKAMSKALTAVGGDPLLFKSQTGTGYNSSKMALQLKKLGGSPEEFITRYIVSAAIPLSYPQPKPLAHAALGLDYKVDLTLPQEQPTADVPAAAAPHEEAPAAHAEEAHHDDAGLVPIDDAAFADLDNELAGLDLNP